MPDAAPQLVTTTGSTSLEGVAKGTLLLRLTLAALTVPAIDSSAVAPHVLLPTLVAVLAASLVPLLAWEAAARSLRRHPVLLSVDLATSVIFLAVAGTSSPFIVATTATAFLGGLTLGWPGAAVSATLLAGSFVVITFGEDVVGATSLSEPVSSGMAALLSLYPLLGAAGSGLRRILTELDDARQQRVRALALAAAADERAAVARDLHDTFGKSLHGIAMAARALSGADPASVATQAKMIERGADIAAQQARSMMRSLRAPTCLRTELRRLADELADEDGWTVDVDIDIDDALPPRTVVEVSAAVSELLENVRRHVGPGRVELSAHGTDPVTIVVRDDGPGIAPGTVDAAVERGRFGIVGVRERIARCGGVVEWHAPPTGGTTVTVTAPATTSTRP